MVHKKAGVFNKTEIAYKTVSLGSCVYRHGIAFFYSRNKLLAGVCFCENDGRGSKVVKSRIVSVKLRRGVAVGASYNGTDVSLRLHIVIKACLEAVYVIGEASAQYLKGVEGLSFVQIFGKVLRNVHLGIYPVGVGEYTESAALLYVFVNPFEYGGGDSFGLGITVDVSHLNDRGFDELYDMGITPIIATHSNLRSVKNHPRNLTENQFKKIVSTGGVVGINFYTEFLGDDPFEYAFRHVYRMLCLGGENAVAIGSDFDGADFDRRLNSVEKITKLAEYLLSHGLTDDTVEKIMFNNALRVLGE